MNATPFRSPRAGERTAGSGAVRLSTSMDAAAATETSADAEDIRPVAGPAGSHPAVRRILARHAGRSPETLPAGSDGDQFDLAERQALRRVAGLSTELQDVSEV